MSDGGFNDELLEKELFGADSDDLDGAGMDVDEMIGMGDSVAGLAGEDSAGDGSLDPLRKGGATAEANGVSNGTAAAATTAAATTEGPGADGGRPQQLPAKPVDIEMDVPPGEITVLTHEAKTRPTASQELTSCATYDILPTMSFVSGYQMHAVAATASMRWVFTGGEDGYIRKWDMDASAGGKQLLTQGQRHALVDSVSKAGVMASYWDHSDKTEDTEMLSPVYSLAVQSQAEWLVSGMKSGHIGLWTVRHDEGRRVALLAKHSKPVSVLRISPDEFGLVSGSWDRAVLYWDLNSGKIARAFAGHVSQISSAEFRPTLAPELRATDTNRDDSDDRSSRRNSQEEDGDSSDRESGTAASQAFDVKAASHVLLTASIDGQCYLWDVRAPHRLPHALNAAPRTPRWAASACWSVDGSRIYVGRRNNTIDEYDVAMMGSDPVRTLRLPMNSGPVTAVAAMPNGRSLVCASTDNVRMWNLADDSASDGARAAVPFQIVPGHHGGAISSILVDERSRYMLTTSGNRGWEGSSNNLHLGYEISPLDR
ncbi:Transcription factor spt8 [Coemansia sp. RSA 1939]|nr:Transcription factor spt8 [Coemansia sp. RSA 1939]KAJ2613613.1 Transcription factor spt8 [Coemansia sp. RSA 1804]